MPGPIAIVPADALPPGCASHDAATGLVVRTTPTRQGIRMTRTRITAALAAVGLVSAALIGTGATAGAATAPVISGPATLGVLPGATVTIAGTAPAGSKVGIWFHKRTPIGATQLYTQRRTLTVGSSGRFSTTYLANDDYRYYAEVNGVKSNIVLAKIPVRIAGPLTQTATPNQGYHLAGVADPSTVVRLHLHAKGTAATDYSITRTANVSAKGVWTFKIASDTDYRIFAISFANSTVTVPYLLQQR